MSRQANRSRGIKSPLGYKGFTLIELMITVAIVALLATIAVPSYMNSVRKSKRAEAKTCLLEAAQKEERYYYQNGNTYGDFAQLGYTIRHAHLYRRKLHTYFHYCPNATAFTIKASPIAGTTQANDAYCTGFSLNQAGLQRRNRN